MGTPLASSEFSKAWDRLRNEIVLLRNLWEEYQYLFGSGPERVEVLNFCASWFFGLTQRVFIREILLAIARLTDREATASSDNLTIAVLLDDPALTANSQDAAELAKLVALATTRATAIRVHRHKYIAHLDRDLAVAKVGVVLPEVRHETIEGAVGALEAAFVEHSRRVRRADIDLAIRPLKSAHSLYEILRTSERWKRWEAAERENPSY